MKKNPMISVIVPVYNTEKYLKRCLESLVNQTYKELEIILVNDASTDDSGEIIEEYILTDSRIKCVKHPKNRGLFQARITGVQASHGEYIAFVDSDDYVSVDWFRLLVKKASEESADITVGEWCFEYETGWKEYLNLDPFRIQDMNLQGEDVINEFMRQEGRCFSWHVVWNKLYSRRIWNQCEKDFVGFSNEHGHMLMWEDVAFSSGFWNCAKKVVNVHGINYYYYKHSTASTSQFSVKNKTRGEKYINDASSAMDFMEKMLKKHKHYLENQPHYKNWLLLCKHTLYHDLVENLSSKLYLKHIANKLGPIEKSEFEMDNFFYQNMTPLDNSFSWLEEIKATIAADETKVVSFDVFDTLIQRPFFEPTDLFNILSDKFNDIEKTSSYVDFKKIRISAEKEVRKAVNIKHPAIEEITLDEIYTYITQNYVLNSETIDALKRLEIELECAFCYTRECGKTLYELAQYCQKKVIICSDMYLSKEVIEGLLKKNGYSLYDAIYISSEIKLSKNSGRLFDYICKDLKIKHSERKNCIHIGDNWHSDVECPNKKGWKSGHLARAINVFKGENPGIYAGDLFKNVLQNTYHLTDTYWANQDFLGLSCAFALVANRIYDTPYISINRGSDFNMNPYTIGYATLGPHLLALVRWIEHHRKLWGNGKIHFVARDGYLVKKAYDTVYGHNGSSNYLRLSRKSLILADVNSIADLYSIYSKATITGLSPKEMEGFLQPILDKNALPQVHKMLEEAQIPMERNFVSLVDFNAVLKIYIENAADMNRLADYKQELSSYFASFIHEGDILFDIGYSGRPEAALSNLLGFPINSLYIHTLKDIAEKRQRHYGCVCKTFYDFKPAITGVIREHLLMELGPSTIGYQKKDGILEPIYEKRNSDYCSDYITRILQNAAIDYVKDFHNMFDPYLDNLIFRNHDISLPLEYYLHNSKEMDRRIFSTMEFEDDMGEGRTFSALAFWNNDIAQRNLFASGSNSAPGEVIPNMYMDGLFVKFFNWINKTCPYGSKKREMLKKIARRFIH